VRVLPQEDFLPKRMKVTIKGLDKFLKRLDEFSNLEHLDRDLEVYAEKIRRRARQYSPVRTGRLRESIQVEKLGFMKYAIGSKLYYSIFVEKGHRIVAWGHDTGKFKPGVYFLKRALDDHKRGLIRCIIRDLFMREIARALQGANE